MNEESEIIEIPPSTNQITAMIHADGMSLKKAIAELVANALDQDATLIELSYWHNDKGTAVLTISDNGYGCRDLKIMIALGSHYNIRKGKVLIGRYGVGFKDSVIWLGDYVWVDSMTEVGEKSQAFANWKTMIDTNKWSVELWKDSERTERGVTIQVQGLRERRMRSWEKVPSYIAELFSAAIDEGVVIKVDGKLVKANPQPLLEDPRVFKGKCGDLAFEGICGLLVDRRAAPSGWELRYGHQTIVLGYIKEGFGNYSPQGFYGRFKMLDGDDRWHLTRNKTDSEDLVEVMNCKEMQKIMKPILEKLKKRSETLHIKLNQKLVQTQLTTLLQNARVRLLEQEEEGGSGENEGNGGTRGGNGEKGGSGKRKKREYDEIGDAKAKIKQAQVVAIAAHDQPTFYGIGYVAVTERNTLITIYLIGEDHPIGQLIWNNSALLTHYSVMLLAQHLGLEVGLFEQLSLKIGDCRDEQVRMAKTCLYLLEHSELESKTNAGVA